MSQVSSPAEFGIASAWLAQQTLETLDAAVLVFDDEARIARWNVRTAEVLGVDEVVLSGRLLVELGWRVQGGAAGTQCPITTVLSTTQPTVASLIGRSDERTDGDKLTVSAVPVFGPDRRVHGVMASLVRAAQPEDGRGGAERLASVSDHSLLANLIVAESGRVVDWNHRLLGITGRSESAIVAEEFESLCDLDLEWVLAALRSSGGTPVVGRTWITHVSGEDIPVVGNFRLAWHTGGERCVFAEFLDVAEFRVGTSLPAGVVDGESFDSTTVATLVLSDGGEIVDANDAATELLGGSQCSLRQDPLASHVTFDDEPVGSDALRAAWSAKGHVVKHGRLRPPARTGDTARRRSAGHPVTVVLQAVRTDNARPAFLAQILPCERSGAEAA
ncbi:MAG: PAS domain-containing protein [Ilumatobacter sp.]|uniref:PAS domain-containing protein n=1 Tax=Ilumatobacter sp. TaxID=1967498 RepID=UPI002630855F|nr:PAS domain-containing protein [Ilumatobacter sp.]MDJ0767422.1 PAS domain-containing protein [Ilumatobacter sp.]